MTTIQTLDSAPKRKKAATSEQSDAASIEAQEAMLKTEEQEIGSAVTHQPEEEGVRAKNASRSKKIMERINEVRIEGLGLAALIRDRSRTYIDDALEIGRNKQREKEQLAIEEKNENSPDQADANVGAKKREAKEGNTVKKALTELRRLRGDASSLIVGLNEKLAEDRVVFIDTLSDKAQVDLRKKTTEKGKSKPEEASEEKGLTEEEPQAKDDVSLVSLKERLENAKKLRNGLRETLTDQSKKMIDDAKIEGKKIDYEMRRKMAQQKLEYRERMRNFWSGLGIASKNEITDLNRKIMALSQVVVNGERAEDATKLLQNRRAERRQENAGVDYERRVVDERRTVQF